jgi:hypothetical protein
MSLPELEQSRERTLEFFLSSSKREKPGISPQPYLKCWGCDYPYLKNAEGYPERWLPVPEDSKAQRIIRATLFPFQMK